MNGQTQHVERARIGPFEANFPLGELRRHGIRLKIYDQPLEILEMLVSRPGQLVTREEIRQRLWPSGTYVDFDNGLNSAINRLRTVLGDSAEAPKFIETIPRRGYRLIAQVEYVETAPVNPPAKQPMSDTVDVRVPWFDHRWLWVGASTFAIFVIIVVWWLSFSRKAHALTDKDTIVLADFANRTGDTVFDGTLRQGLSIQLEQSPFLSIISDQQVQQTLQMMGQNRDAKLTPEIARELCQRTGSAAVLDGSITQIGTPYLLTIKAINCSNGDSLASAEAQANDKNHVLNALGKMAAEIRSRLGESLASVQKYDAPPENVTTPSLEALKAYSVGYEEAVVRNNSAAAIPLYQRAVGLDPNFAMAYARLGMCYDNLGETARAAETIRKAYELRERVSEREKFYIASHYESFGTGNVEASRTTYELWAQTYPRDDVPPGNLCDLYFYLGSYDKALTACQQALRLNSANGLVYAELVAAFLYLDRLDEAKTTAQQAQARGLDTSGIHTSLYLVNFLQNDSAGMEREAASLMGKPGYEDRALYSESDTAAYGGQFGKARELTRRAAESARRADDKETAASFEAEAAVREALVGNLALAKQQAQAALALSNGRYVQASTAFALALSGDSGQADRLRDDLGKRFPEDTTVQFGYLPMIRAAVALEGHGASKAVEALAAAAPYELGLGLYPIYLRGGAFLAEHQSAAATAEFQKILEHRGVVVNQAIGALAHLQAGRAYALSGDNDKAKSAYQDFLTLWKDADPDIPILKQAQAEYAKLK